MGLTKTESFTEQQNRLAGYFKALAHPARVAILQVLIEKNACICGDIVDELPLAQPTVSQHLKELKNAGIIKGNIEGTSICYCIDETAWAEMKTVLGDFLGSVRGKCC
ncbi:MAG: metalloregulator ArsR/SmtB family transcription factor [Cytophagales bacterium]|jgi:DNA-binding transcriptional ArsR family regulator|nr:metalloregulator ArsR/SmtB family transcription factor [Cytophagales bacterium]